MAPEKLTKPEGEEVFVGLKQADFDALEDGQEVVVLRNPKAPGEKPYIDRQWFVFIPKAGDKSVLADKYKKEASRNPGRKLVVKYSGGMPDALTKWMGPEKVRIGSVGTMEGKVRRGFAEEIAGEFRAERLEGEEQARKERAANEVLEGLKIARGEHVSPDIVRRPVSPRMESAIEEGAPKPAGTERLGKRYNLNELMAINFIIEQSSIENLKEAIRKTVDEGKIVSLGVEWQDEEVKLADILSGINELEGLGFYKADDLVADSLLREDMIGKYIKAPPTLTKRIVELMREKRKRMAGGSLKSSRKTG